jgi:hypothetical protein
MLLLTTILWPLEPSEGNEAKKFSRSGSVKARRPINADYAADALHMT